MRSINRISIMFLAFLPFTLMSTAQEDVRERDFIRQYDKGSLDGFRVTILLQQDNGWLAPVAPNREFQQGERVKIGLESNFRSYVYIVNLGTSGKKTVIFPDGKESNLLLPMKQYTLPQSYNLMFNEDKGFETLQVLISRRPIPLLDAAIKNRDGELNERQAQALEGLSKNPLANQAGITMNAETSRDPVWDKKKQSTIVAAPRTNRAKGKAEEPKVAAFVIKLRNAGARR